MGFLFGKGILAWKKCERFLFSAEAHEPVLGVYFGWSLVAEKGYPLRYQYRLK